MTHRKFFAYRSFWPELETIRKFGQIGIDQVAFFPGNSANSLGEPYSKYPSNWLWFDNYDFTPVERQINDILSANPNAELIAMLDLNSPLWLQRQLAGENCDSFTNLSEALASSRWGEATEAYLRAIIGYLEENYDDRICAYVLACGYTDEWMDYSDGGDSPEKYHRYAEYCRRHNWSVPVDVPQRSVRNHASFDELLRDPAVDAEALNYWRFTSDLIVDGIVHFARLARSLIRTGVEIGVFYGYILELTSNRLVRSGHLAYERLLADGAVDFLISPGTYSHRQMGAGGGFMIPDGTIRRYGKNYLHECDQRTHCFNANLTDVVKLEFFHWKDENEDIIGMRREMALSLIKHTSLWWFDMWGGYYQSEAVFENLRVMRELWKKYSEGDEESLAEIALVVDPASICYLDDSSEEITAKIHRNVRNSLNAVGAPFDVISFNDIAALAETGEFRRYKLLIVPSLYEVTSAKREILEKFVFRAGRTVFWLYGAGLSDGETIDVARMEELTGHRFGAGGGGVVGRAMAEWNSVYARNYDAATPAQLKRLALEAGVTIWIDAAEPVFANRRLACFHTACGGVWKLRFPEGVAAVTELYSGKRFDVEEGCVEYSFAAPDTALFELKWMNQEQ